MTTSTKPPNFLLIVADDLGFSDVACFGGEIRTPNLDKLAHDGLRMTNFHAAAACSPTRAMIMTGTDHHIAGLGNLVEWTTLGGQAYPKGSPYSTKPQRGMPGYEGYLNDRVATLPEILRSPPQVPSAPSYHTLMSGKWHLGLTPQRFPFARGFDRSLALLPACANHYGWRPDAEKQDGGIELPRFLEKTVIALHVEDDHYVDDLPEDFYSSNTYAEKMIKYLQDWKETSSDGARQEEKQHFFAYLPFSAPHWPLQAPQEYIKHYDGMYSAGPEHLRQARLKRLVELGMISAEVVPHPVVADEVPGWDKMSATEQALSAKAMEAYAGMVECMDWNIGRVVDYLKDIGEFDNTFIMFISDNGAEGAAYEAYPMIRDSVKSHLTAHYNNSLENIGNYDSFVWYGPRWAQAATAPSRLYKAFTTEGGVRVPAIIHWPGMAQDRKGSISDAFATVMDIAPTVLELAKISHPAPVFQSRPIVSMRGLSMLPFLLSSYSSDGTDAHTIHPSNAIHGWELCGKAAIRKGDYKAVFIPPPKGPGKWQCYDLRKDPGEVNDLAERIFCDAEGKEVDGKVLLAGLLEDWEAYVNEVGVVPLQPELGKWVEAREEQMVENAWMEYEYWKPGALKPDRRNKFFRQIPKLDGTNINESQ